MRGMAPCVFFSIPAFHPKGKGARQLCGQAVPAAGCARPVCAVRALWFGKLKQCPRGEKAGSALQGRASAQGRLCRKHAAAAFFSRPYCSMQFASPGGAKRLCLASDAKDRKTPWRARRLPWGASLHDAPGTAGQTVCLPARPRHAGGILWLRMIFMPRGHSAAQMAFLFVCAQHALNLPV